MKSWVMRAFLWIGLGVSLQAVPPVSLTVDATAPGTKVSPMLYGIFFEEINRAGDGGLYAEMIQNRSFEDWTTPLSWTLIQGKGAEAKMELDKSQPLNEKNPTSLRLEVIKPGERVGVCNQGFKGVAERGDFKNWGPKFEKAMETSTAGLNIQTGKEYNFSIYLRAATGFKGPVSVDLEKQDGTVLASGNISEIGAKWKKYELRLTASGTDTNARLVISTTTPGIVWMDMVSLFPKDTFKGRSNGLRKDLAEMVAAMHPAFVRFPGGCFVEGDHIAEASRWKQTIGDVAQRPGHWNLWGYRSTDGLGFLEYLEFCEDIGAEPLFVINVGMAHKDHVPMDKMSEFVQDALDAIEYANGPVDSHWGALRARDGHPEPFHLRYMEIGNENGGDIYNERYALFHDAIKAKYPEIKLVACDWKGVPKNRPLDIVDKHDYSDPEAFLVDSTLFDSIDPHGPKIYMGEYAVTRGGCGTGNLRAAVAEAGFMTGLERNGDRVVMASYAPLFVEPSWKTWNPNAIVFNSSRAYGTPSYYVQALFAANRSDTVYPLQIDQPAPQPKPFSGLIGVGTWDTQSEYKDIQVIKDGKVLYSSDFSHGLNGWKTPRGTWETVDGALRQTKIGPDTLALFGDKSWSDYTLSLKARKISGAEGFLITFAAPDDKTRSWWNIGGWGNLMHGLAVPGVSETRVGGSIETGRWYDIRVELKGGSIKCYLDGKLIHDVYRHQPNAMYAVFGSDPKSKEWILKVVNAADHPIEAAINLKGISKISSSARLITLTSANLDDENSFDELEKIHPHEEAIAIPGASFPRIFPASSVSILRLKSE